MTSEQVDLRTKEQLEILREISIIFGDLQAEFWLKGGWAIDFLLGRITRQHSDIDMAVWVKNRDLIEDALLKSGYTRNPVGEEFVNRQSDFNKYHTVISIVYITYTAGGELILNGLPEWVWRADSLLPQHYRLHEIEAKVIHPKQLLDEKEIYREIGRPYRQKDEDSKRILRYIVSDYK